MPQYAPQLKIKSAEALKRKIDGYEAWCAENGHHVTWSALAYYLGVTTETLRQYTIGSQKTLDDEMHKKICSELARAWSICQLYAHDRLYDKDTARGAQFDLSANYNMSDRRQVDVNTEGITVKLADGLDGLGK